MEKRLTADEHAHRMAACGHCGESLPNVEQEIAALRAVARAASDYLGWQDGTMPADQRASGAAHRLHLFNLLKVACPELLHTKETNDAR